MSGAPKSEPSDDAVVICPAGQRAEPSRRLGEILLEVGAIDADTLARALAEQYGLDFVDARDARVDPQVLSRVSRSDAQRLGFLPLSAADDAVAVAVADPTDRDLLEEIGAIVGTPIEPVVSPPGPLKEAIEAAWSAKGSAKGEPESAQQVSTQSLWKVEPVEGAPVQTSEQPAPEPEPATTQIQAPDLPAELEPTEEGPPPALAPGPVTLDFDTDGAASLPSLMAGLGASSAPADFARLLSGLLGGALHWEADAVRIDRIDDGAVVAYRLDGYWRVRIRLPSWAWDGLVAGAATLFGSPGATLRELDGRRLESHVDSHDVEFVVSLAGSASAPRVAFAVRDPRRQVALDQLGLPPDLGRRLRQWTAAREGLLLVVGPHDSGRTTIVRALGSQLGSYRPLMMVLRHPIEPPASTLWVERGSNDEQGVEALTRALESNPQVVVVDDCDSPRLADLAFRASFRDRLVVAVLRGRDAAEALQRLRDQGIDDLLLGDQIVGIVETRQLRLLCSNCWVRGPLDRALAGRLNLVVDSIPGEVPVAGPGCPLCHHTGFRGRRSLFSRVELGGGVRDGASPEELRQAVTMRRPRTAAELGLSMVIQGMTSLQEVARVLAPRPRRSAAPTVSKKAEPPPSDEPATPEAEPIEGPSAPEAPSEPKTTPVVSITSPEWDPDASEDTVAEATAPIADDDDDLDGLDLADLLDFDVGASDADDRHVVLVLDPKEDVPKAVAGSLPDAEFRVVGLQTLADAMDFVRVDLPTAIVLAAGWHFDCGGALHALREDLSSAFLPLIVIAEDDEQIVELLRAGADEVIPSEVDSEELELRIRAVIRRVT